MSAPPEVCFTYEQTRAYRSHFITGSLQVAENVQVTVTSMFQSPDLDRDHLQYWLPMRGWTLARHRGAEKISIDEGHSRFPAEVLGAELSRYWNPLTAAFMASQWTDMDGEAFALAHRFVKSRARMGYTDFGLGFTSSSLSSIHSVMEMPHV